MENSNKIRILIFFTFIGLLAACAEDRHQNSHQINEGIVNGTEVDYEEAVYKRVLYLKTSFVPEGEDRVFQSQCSASAIAPRLILTAAHCLQKAATFQRIEYQTPTEKMVVKVISAVPHPDYNADKKNDIALLLLEKDLPAEIEILSLPAPSDPLPALIEAAGFGRSDGRINSSKPGTGTLRRKKLPVEATSRSPLVFSVEQSEGGACQGDSGSPAMAEWNGKTVAFGVLARTLFMPSEAPDLDRCSHRAEYTNVLSFLDFINETSKTLLAESQL